MSELVKGAIAEADACDKQGPPQDEPAGTGSDRQAELPSKAQLGRSAKDSLQVGTANPVLAKLCCLAQ